MLASELTSKAQTTIPHAVRTALGLRPGDEIAYVIENGRVIVTRVADISSTDDPFATFSEWASDLDVAAYGHL